MAVTAACGQIEYGFQGGFIQTENQFHHFFLQGILTFKETCTLKFVKIVQNSLNLYLVLLALVPEACATTKSNKDFWLNLFRRGLKNLDAVLNRVGKSEISVLNRIRV